MAARWSCYYSVYMYKYNSSSIVANDNPSRKWTLFEFNAKYLSMEKEDKIRESH